MTTTETAKPRWVECADEASEVLGTAAGISDPSEKDVALREADAWMRLAYLYRGNSAVDPS